MTLQLTNLKTTLLYQILPWILPKRIHELLILVTDQDNARQIRALRWTLKTIQMHQSSAHRSSSEDRPLLNHIQIQNIQMLSQLTDLQRNMNALAHQSRLQQEDHFVLERRLMEMKFGQDPMLLSSDSVFGGPGSLDDSICIQAINVEPCKVSW